MIKCDANKLPEEIKRKAREYAVKRKPRFRTFGIVSDDVEDAWLNGFATCMEGTGRKPFRAAVKAQKRLTKAKELLKGWLEDFYSSKTCHQQRAELVEQSEQFLNKE